MDISKEYIKMCDKSGLKECCSYASPNYSAKIKYFGDNVFVELDRSTTTWRTVRLLRQSQIQEMFLQYWGLHSLIKHFYEFEQRMRGRGDVGNPSKTMEQLWLAFYMYEKHKKVWDGEKWAKR